MNSQLVCLGLTIAGCLCFLAASLIQAWKALA